MRSAHSQTQGLLEARAIGFGWWSDFLPPGLMHIVERDRVTPFKVVSRSVTSRYEVCASDVTVT